MELTGVAATAGNAIRPGPTADTETGVRQDQHQGGKAEAAARSAGGRRRRRSRRRSRAVRPADCRP